MKQEQLEPSLAVGMAKHGGLALSSILALFAEHVASLQHESSLSPITI